VRENSEVVIIYPDYLFTNIIWLVVSTPLKNMSSILFPYIYIHMYIHIYSILFPYFRMPAREKKSGQFRPWDSKPQNLGHDPYNGGALLWFMADITN